MSLTIAPPTPDYVAYILTGEPAREQAKSYLDELTQELESARQHMRFATEAMPGSHEKRDSAKLARKLSADALVRAEQLAVKGNWLRAAQLRLIAVALTMDAAWHAG